MMQRKLSVKALAPRRGVALVLLLVYLAVLAVLITAVVRNGLAQKRFLERRENQVQANWLAEAGIEQAVARLLADPKVNKGETFQVQPGSAVWEKLQILPRSEVGVTVYHRQESPHIFEITSEATYPTGDIGPASSRIVRLYRLTQEAGKRMLVREYE